MIPWLTNVKKPELSAAYMSCLVISSLRFSQSITGLARENMGATKLVPAREIAGTSLSVMIRFVVVLIFLKKILQNLGVLGILQLEDGMVSVQGYDINTL